MKRWLLGGLLIAGIAPIPLAAPVTLTLSFPCLAASAQDAEPKVDPRVDNYGDPLPPGALLRLGTIRLQGERFAWMPDGKSLVTVSAGRFWIWDIEDGRPLKSIPGPIDAMGGLTPDGSKIIGNSTDGRLAVYDLDAQKFLPPGEKLDSYEVRTVTIAPDSASFATSSGNTVRVWDVASGEPLLNLSIDEKWQRGISLMFSPDSRRLAVGAGRTIRLFDLEDAAKPAIIENAHGGNVNALAFTPDGKQLISAGTAAFKTAKVRDDGAHLGTEDCEVSIWDVAEGKRLATLDLPKPMNGSCLIALAPDGDTLVTAHRERTFVWNLAERRVVRTLEGNESTTSTGLMMAAVDPTGKYFAANYHESHIRVYELASGEGVFAEHERHSDRVLSAMWSRDGSRIVTGSDDGTVRIWDATSGRQKRAIKNSARFIYSVAFTADDASVLVGGENFDETEGEFHGSLRKLSVADGKLDFELSFADRMLKSAASRDGERIAVATGVGPLGFGDPRPTLVHVYSVSTGEKLAEIKGCEGCIESLGWSADGSVVMAAEDTNVVRSFKVASGRELSALETPHEREDMGMIVKTSLHCAVFVGDGTTVLTNGSFTKDVDAWDLATGESLWTLDAKVNFIRGMTVSPDERIVALNGRESNPRRTTLSFWDTAMRRELLHIDVGEEYVTSMAFSADGNQLVTGLETGTALVWDVSAVWDKLGGNPSD